MFNLMPYNRRDNNLFHFFDNFEQSFFGDSMMDLQRFRTDILDCGNEYQLSAELPGFDKEDIRIDIDHNTLTISAKHEQDSEEQQEHYVRRERRYGAFSRSFDITGVNPDGIRAAYNNGLLTLELPKRQPEQLPPSRQVEIQ